MATGAVTPEDLHSDDYRYDPHPYWVRLRHEQPIFHDTIDNVWALTRYDDVVAVFKDWETYSTKPYNAIFGPVIGVTLAELDGPEHVHRRTLLAPPFAGKRLETYIDAIKQTTDRLASALPPSKSDVLADYITHIPVRVMAAILGFPEEDHDFFLETAYAIMAGLEGVEPALSRGIHAHRQLGEYVDPIIQQRIANPGDDVISRIVNAEVDGQRLDPEEMKTFISLLVNAGGQTTSDAITLLWWDLLRHPDVLERARHDEAVLDRAFSEMMRRDGPVVYEDRLTTRPVEWYGQEIPAGSIVRMFMASANTDDEVFDAPLEFDVDRTDLQMGLEKRMGVRNEEQAGQLGFGLGRHFCLGWHLARSEALIATQPLLHRMKNVRFAGDVPIPPVQFLVRRLDRLDLEYDLV